jgi:hypothetical protein
MMAFTQFLNVNRLIAEPPGFRNMHSVANFESKDETFPETGTFSLCCGAHWTADITGHSAKTITGPLAELFDRDLILYLTTKHQMTVPTQPKSRLEFRSSP